MCAIMRWIICIHVIYMIQSCIYSVHYLYAIHFLIKTLLNFSQSIFWNLKVANTQFSFNLLCIHAPYRSDDSQVCGQESGNERSTFYAIYGNFSRSAAHAFHLGVASPQKKRLTWN